MRSSRPADPGALALAALEAALEGGWLLVVYASFEVGLVHHVPALGPVEFVLAAAAGIWLVRRRPANPGLALGVLAAAAVIGWLSSPTAWQALLTGSPVAALVAHPGGLLLGAAVLRGGAHREPLDDVEISAAALRVVAPLLVIPWLVGAVIPEPALHRDFVGLAWTGTLLFVVAAFASLGLGRLRLLGLAADPRDRMGRTWFLVTAAVPLALIAIAVPLALWFGLRPEDLAEAILRPGVLLFSLVALLVAPPIVAGGVLASLFGVGHDATTIGGATGGRGIAPGPLDSGQLVTIALILAVMIILLALAILAWLRPPRPRLAMRAVIPEERVRALPIRSPRRWSAWRRPGPLVPHDAATAYVATLALLEGRPTLARGPAETPAGHARRLADQGADADGALRRLAADYQLARYAGRRITRSETARALGRWRLRHARRGLD